LSHKLPNLNDHSISGQRITERRVRRFASSDIVVQGATMYQPSPWPMAPGYGLRKRLCV